MTIHFVTSNNAKVKYLKGQLKDHNIDIIQRNIPIPEIQHASVEEIAIHKATEAYKILRYPLITHDSGFYIRALNDYPGPYVKYTLSTIGIEGILKLMEDKEDRTCYFKSTIAYIDDLEHIRVFNSKNSIGDGVIAKYIANSNKTAWSPLWNICIPKWSDLPLSNIDKGEIERQEKSEKNQSEFKAFTAWLSKS